MILTSIDNILILSFKNEIEVRLVIGKGNLILFLERDIVNYRNVEGDEGKICKFFLFTKRGSHMTRISLKDGMMGKNLWRRIIKILINNNINIIIRKDPNINRIYYIV